MNDPTLKIREQAEKGLAKGLARVGFVMRDEIRKTLSRPAGGGSTISAEAMQFLAATTSATAAKQIAKMHGGRGSPPGTPPFRRSGQLYRRGIRYAAGEQSVTVGLGIDQNFHVDKSLRPSNRFPGWYGAIHEWGGTFNVKRTPKYWLTDSAGRVIPGAVKNAYLQVFKIGDEIDAGRLKMLARGVPLSGTRALSSPKMVKWANSANRKLNGRIARGEISGEPYFDTKKMKRKIEYRVTYPRRPFIEPFRAKADAIATPILQEYITKQIK